MNNIAPFKLLLLKRDVGQTITLHQNSNRFYICSDWLSSGIYSSYNFFLMAKYRIQLEFGR